MSNGPSGNGWSKLFKSSSSSANNSKNKSQFGDHLYSENPFHRPPSAASNFSEQTFRTGSASAAASSATAYQSGSSGGSKDRLGDKGSLHSAHSGGGHSGHSGGGGGYAESTMSALDLDDDGECPVCLEPLSFSFRLPGEKPHIVPECGHALHEACFSAVYGPIPTRNPAGGIPRKSSLGVCGVCRRPMKVSEGDTGKSNKLAALTGMGERASSSPYNSHPSTPHHPSKLGPGGSVRSPAHRGRDAPGSLDPTEDDPVEKDHHNNNSNNHGGGGGVVAPSITVRSEFNTIHRNQQTVQPLTCIVIVELPSKRSPTNDRDDTIRSMMPVGNMNQDEGVYSGYQQHLGRKPSVESSQYGYRDEQPSRAGARDTTTSMGSQDTYNPPPTGNSYATNYTNNTNSYQTNYTSGVSGNSSQSGPDSPFNSITEDLKQRVADWKGHPMSGLGPLQMFDILSVRRDVLVREFYVYLFKEAIICVLEEKKKSLGRLLSPTGSGDSSTGSNFNGSNANKGVLRLKGRIYIRHIKQVHDTSSAGELSLTIDMEDERLESFILIFRDRATLESWKTNVNNLVLTFQQGGSTGGSIASSGRGTMDSAGTIGPSNGGGSRSGHGHGEMDEFGTGPLSVGNGGGYGGPQGLPKGISGKAARMLSGSSDGSAPERSMGSSSASGYGAPPPQYNNNMGGGGGKLNKMPSEDNLGYGSPSMGFGTESRTITPHVATTASNNLQPLPHPPLDLILVISVPPADMGNAAYSSHLSPATAQLKVRVIRNSLDFVIGQLGPRDRLSLVSFEVGVGGRVRKTPFLGVGRPPSKKRLMAFVDAMFGPEDGRDDSSLQNDEFLVRNVNEEKTDVVTAVNHGLDVVLQRKGKNPVSGMVLVSDAADSTRRAQMDLVLARAEAANVPIHSFGYGRSHDPASLWLISNHTSGTYTFVKDWYDLRDCLAGCLGGMMSIGLLNMKVHMKIVDANRFRIRKVSGGPTAIVAQDGKDVHVEVGELRYGERKEMLVELELDNNLDIMRMNNMGVNSAPMGGGRGNHDNGDVMQSRNGGMMNATDAFVARMGLDISGDSPNLMDGVMDRMIDEVPVFEVDGSFFDPAASRQVSRLAHPVLLTVTLLPVTQRPPASPNTQPPSDAVIVRRRMELLASDMVTRALVLVSRKNYSQATRILAETRRILTTVLQSISQSLPPPSGRHQGNMTPSSSSGMVMARNRKEMLVLSTVRALQAMLQDLQILIDALDENVDLFAHDQRNFGAQQAMILRDQKSWSKRSSVEKLFWTVDNSIELVSRSVDWVGRD